MSPHLKGACWRFPLGCYFYFANSERHPAWDERQSPLGGGRPLTRYSIRSSSVLTALIGPKVEVSYALPPRAAAAFACMLLPCLLRHRRQSFTTKYSMSSILLILSFSKKLCIFARLERQGAYRVRTRIAQATAEGATHYTTATYLLLTLIKNKKKSVYNDNIVKQFNTWAILPPHS